MFRLLFLLALSLPLIFAAPKSWDDLARLRPGAPLEVVVGDHSERGEFVASSEKGLTIRTAGGERNFARQNVLRVVSRAHSHRLRNILIGAGAGAVVGLVADQTLGVYLRNESNPDSARPIIWAVPIGIGAGIGAAVPSHSVIYRK